MVQVIRPAVLSVVETYVERATDGDNALLALLVGVPATTLAGRYVVRPICPPYLKWHLPVSLCHSKVATRVGNAWQVDNSSYGHIPLIFLIHIGICAEHSFRQAFCFIAQRVGIGV